MGFLDTYIVYRFIRMLTTPWDETDAFTLGIIDGSGHPQKDVDDLKTDKEKAAYTLFHRLVYNIKRLVEKLPGGKTKIGTYAAALFLLKEQLGDDEGVIIFERTVMTILKEHKAMDAQFLNEQYLPEDTLSQGNYKLRHQMLDQKGDVLPKGTLVVAKYELKAISRVLGVDVYQLHVAKNNKPVIVSQEDIEEV